MPNHFHWLIHINEEYDVLYDLNEGSRKLNPLNKSVGTLLSSYTQSINRKTGRSGSLFRKRTKAKSLSADQKSRDSYGANCFFYIHQNPLRAGLVSKMEDWGFSSFRDYAEMRNGTLCNKELAIDLFMLPKNSNEFRKVSQKTIPDHIMKKLF